MRARDDEDFCNWTQEIGNGSAGETVTIPREFMVTSDQLVEALYGSDTTSWNAESMIS